MTSFLFCFLKYILYNSNLVSSTVRLKRETSSYMCDGDKCVSCDMMPQSDVDEIIHKDQRIKSNPRPPQTPHPSHSSVCIHTAAERLQCERQRRCCASLDATTGGRHQLKITTACWMLAVAAQPADLPNVSPAVFRSSPTQEVIGSSGCCCFYRAVLPGLCDGL